MPLLSDSTTGRRYVLATRIGVGSVRVVWHGRGVKESQHLVFDDAVRGRGQQGIPDEGIRLGIARDAIHGSIRGWVRRGTATGRHA